MLLKSYNTVYRCYLGVTTPYIDVIKELQRCLNDVIYVSDPHIYSKPEKYVILKRFH